MPDSHASLPGTATPLAAAHGFAVHMMEMLVVPTFALDVAGKVILWNRACERLTGVPAKEVLGTDRHWRCFYVRQRPTLADLLLQGRGSDLHALYQQQQYRHSTGNNLCAENWCDMPRTGRRRYLAIDASSIFDGSGALIAVMETLRDMTDEKRAQVALERLATRDGLTGLANRRCFDDTLHAEWQRALRQDQPLSLLMVDVDNFKQYNDSHGHVKGDQCLRKVAGAVSGEMRANDLVARYGGEEFAVILPNQTLKGAAIVAERIRCRVERLQLPRSTAGDFRATVTVSIGAATALPGPGTELGQLIHTADSALYRAKHLGRNRISLPEAPSFPQRA
ncbi:MULTISPECIES: diguanylate cyclase [unclassified Janthinobacterium]|uniref:sensor domain-containing diguanylate cyclase n=1 Tax=unclassified Janthinobacterium TaxID=2610881 RepID=UPI001838630C|nr:MULTISPECIES: diguanylate cyclase [unclassified Janthinobacterium]MBB5368370.1 diguanylate cyclase (GGDEF)-like protein [Janthinobacterium sp. K2C7]MBB5382094.1 diguanylate cyclase (GGDEF)-like protein [Janthinobacterium sp. K2Li3]MBB5386752.1 diguanylate cyclase (GGDEF)-like protein [Janthinobacterium sp. K2E3]